ncbi:hypothetical protein WN51_07002 [Melipona quadrifasciata]|uniref:Uncharacterized protein n=1 Tax=Melipona quadrifasciata TaxID=166423 RepID=A0A0N0BCD7_9HYME|nr:hypothetical protein WN51_07002 [Melipona quadrifasciata]
MPQNFQQRSAKNINSKQLPLLIDQNSTLTIAELLQYKINAADARSNSLCLDMFSTKIFSKYVDTQSDPIRISTTVSKDRKECYQ